MSRPKQPRCDITEETTMFDAQDPADRYVAVWNATDPERRRQQIAALGVQDGQHYVDVRETRGYAALEQRITGSHNENVRDGAHRFRATQDARTLRNVVIFHWDMLASAEERIVARGFQVLNVDDEGRILVDYQFILCGNQRCEPITSSRLAPALMGWRWANVRSHSLARTRH
jgi:hypothetical protein